ncbi:hypothetical protein LXA43DRAFT_1098308 [Ganoderma leucocontextum]|nr:hypothetical protein LXA43DRAFT_1098308 [Ganoderma leucocontextum]
MHPGCSQLIFALPAFSRPPVPGTKTLTHDVDHRLWTHAASSPTMRTKNVVDISPRTAQVTTVGVLLPPRPPSTTTIPDYPIVTDFVAWKFPDKIPDHWVRPRPSADEIAELQRKYGACKQKDMPSAVTSDDKACVLTEVFSSVELAYLVPRARADWFRTNDMARYNWGGARTGVHDPANGLILRKDLCTLLDRHGFVFFPAGDSEGNGPGMVVYSCNAYYADYVYLHRTPVAISPRVSDASLYARFAHTMIKLVERDSKFNVFPLPDGARPSRKQVVLKDLPKHAALEDADEQ